jgi:hypothetical protein
MLLARFSFFHCFPIEAIARWQKAAQSGVFEDIH